MSLRVAELESLFTANIQPFEQGAQRVEQTQRRLDGTSARVNVDTNAAAAVQDLQRVESSVRGIPDGQVNVEADTSQASRALDGLESDAAAAGRDAGDAAGEGLSDELMAAIVSIPIAGAIIGIGVTAGKALADGISDGLQVEADADRLMASTGLDPATVGRLARAAGETYANNWGESVSANLDTARIAVQGGILDASATRRDAQAVLEQVAGVADLIGEDTANVIRSVSTLLRTGLAKDAEDALDIIITGQREGLNQSEDLLDTLNEYSTQFRSLGLDAPQALGLLRQAVQGGARDTDVAADALKEFAIRGKELDDSADAYKALGFNAEDMAARVARGGDGATRALGDVLDRLREVEDPVLRDAAAIELFGTKAEDLQGALYGMDLSTAVSELGQVEGAASTALSTLTDNAKNSVETAQRNIELAATGIKGALAEAFAPQIEGAADFVTENREAVIGFLLDIANGALDMGIAFVEGAAVGTEALGSFVSGPLADVADGVAGVLEAFDKLPGDQQLGGSVEGLRSFAEDMRNFQGTADEAADTLRRNLIDNGLTPVQERLNTFGDGLLADAASHDAAVRLANDIDGIGSSGQFAADELDGLREAFETQARTALEAGDSLEDMRAGLDESRTALEEQLEAMGLSEEEAKALADAYDLIPADVATTVTADVSPALAAIAALKSAYTADQWDAYSAARTAGTNLTFNAAGSILAPMAAGGVLSPIAQTVPPGTLRVVGDRMDVDEAYIPLDGSPRSVAILLEAMRRMPGFHGMAAGGITGAPTVIPQSVTHRREQAMNFNGPIYLNGDRALEREIDRHADAAFGGNYPGV